MDFTTSLVPTHPKSFKACLVGGNQNRKKEINQGIVFMLMWQSFSLQICPIPSYNWAFYIFNVAAVLTLLRKAWHGPHCFFACKAKLPNTRKREI